MSARHSFALGLAFEADTAASRNIAVDLAVLKRRDHQRWQDDARSAMSSASSTPEPVCTQDVATIHAEAVLHAEAERDR